MVIGQFGESFIPVYDGVARVMKAYADTLSARGNEVYVITPMYDTGYRGIYPYEIVDFMSVQVSSKLPYRIGLEHLDPHFVHRMSQINLDICHVHGPVFAGNIGVSYAKRKGIPVVGTFHTKFYEDILGTTKMETLAKIGVKMVADFYEKCDEVWAVSEGTGETLKEYGYKGNIIVMPNGTNKRILHADLVPQVKAQYKIQNNKPVLLFVGRITWEKNIKKIIEACGLLKQQGFDFQLLLVGQGPAEQGVKDLAEQCGITSNLTMTGLIKDFDILDCFYSIADLFLFPSVYDNAPMVLREAAAQYTPSLVAAGSCTAEVVQDGVNGILAQDDSADISNKIKAFFKLSEEQRKKMGENAYNTIPVPWDGPLMDTILGRYQDLIDKKKREKY